MIIYISLNRKVADGSRTLLHGCDANELTAVSSFSSMMIMLKSRVTVSITGKRHVH